MVYGIIGMINFAHGDIFMVGAFVALIAFILFALTSIALPIVLILVLLISMVFTACYGWTVEKLAYRYIEGVTDIRNDSKRIADEIQIALKAGKFSTLNAAITLPVSNSIIKVISIPLMTDEEMQKSIETASLWENITQLPDALETYSIFHQIIRKDAASNMMDVLFIASKLSIKMSDDI